MKLSGVVRRGSRLVHDPNTFGLGACGALPESAFNNMAFASTYEIQRQIDVELESREERCTSDERSAGDETFADQCSYAGGSSESSAHDEAQSENGEASVGFFEGMFG